MERYKRNYPSISEDDQEILKTKCVAVIGCGGLGGHIIDCLARIGIGKLILIDCDNFSESNLNRQLLSTEENLGKPKADEAKKRVKSVNSNIETIVVNQMLNKENAGKILSKADIVIDALDNIEGRLIAEDACEKLNLYFIHGAVSGWCAQASTVAPGSHFLEKLYPQGVKVSPPSVLSFVPDFAASIQVSETIKVLLGKEAELEGKLLLADLSNMSFNIIPFM